MSLHVPDGQGGLRPVGESTARRVEPVAVAVTGGPPPVILRPLTTAGSTSYPLGQWAELAFGIVDALPESADIDGKQVAVTPRLGLRADVLHLLERYSEGRRVLGALFAEGSSSWQRGMKTIRVRTMFGGRLSTTEHRIQVI